MVTTTTVYSFQKPAVAGDEDQWGTYLNNNIDKYESILTGNTTITSVVITTADINGGTLDNVVIGGTTAAAVTGTTITGTSFVSSGNMTFGDSDKAIFGAGSDLQIYHDTSNNRLNVTSGNLYVNLPDTSEFTVTGTQNTAFKVDVDGAVTLYNNGSPKITTTSTGIDVTGTVTADGLTVNSGTDNEGISVVSTDAGSYVSVADNGTTGSTRFGAVSNDFKIDVNSAERMRIDSGGDISFYEDTGTTAKFFWDASAESLGIGTTSPSGKIEIVGSTGSAATSGGTAIVRQKGDTSSDGIAITSSNAVSHRIWKSANGSLNIGPSTLSSAFVQDSSGNVGIGTTSPSGIFHAKDASSSLMFKDVSGNAELFIDGSNGDFVGGDYFNIVADSSPNLMFKQANTERMRISSSGDLLVGKTSTNTINTVGHDLTDHGEVMHTTDGGTTMYLNRKTSDGTIVDFRKDGTTVGSIGVYSGDLTVGNGDVGLIFNDAVGLISPWDMTANAVEDNTIDLGYSSGRFKDLYLSASLRLSDSTNTHKYSITATTSDALIFYDTTGNSERMRVSSNGDLLVGRTSTSDTNVGGMIRPDGFVQSTRDGNIAADFNRNTSDGELVRFSKGSSPKGAIGVSADGPAFGTTTQQVAFHSNVLFPCQSFGSALDNAIDLGYSSARFKDLYLSGGVYLGGTGSANKLDDYEEGTFTPQIADATSGGNSTTTGSTIDGHYVKIGDLVYVSVRIIFPNTSGLTSGNVLYIRNLPFTCYSVNGAHPLSVGTARNIDYSYDMITAQISSNTTYFNLESCRSDASEEELTCGQFSGDGTASSPVLYVAGTYRTT